MALLTGHRERERGREGAQTNYAQDKQHADSSSNSRGSNSCCCNLLLIYVEIKNEQQE